ncbi:MAG: DUF1553 domain-containing protein [Planctomycetes bacterium]|nr:DUF1553 domain-containing protein [Planctomycetota bacterium]
MRYILATISWFLVVMPAFGQSAGIEFFEKRIRPVLVEHCYECHATTSKKVRGGLLLDSRDALRKGGESGPAVVPGDPEKSLLIRAVRYTDPDMKMPKKGKLPANVIADLEAWVKMGAPDPRDKATVVKSAKTWDEIVAERRKWWSLQPVKQPAIPTPKDAKWSNDPVDRFLLSAMEAKGIAPAKDADPRTLIRRLSLVLTGLPATVDQTEDFAKAWDAAGAKRGQVLEKLVDRLLVSPHFGERWARHWMDIVRFTETHGNEWNYDVHHAWRYRDYLIRAFNEDVPYDQLIREHIAGDLLPKPRFSRPSPSGRGVGGEGTGRFNESVIGAAFYRFGEVNHDDCIDLRSIGYDLADNQIDTLSKAFQAMTIACARCHDHKLDAISMRDYHGLLGVLRSSRQVAHTIDAPEANADTMRKMRDVKEAIRRELAAAWRREIDPEMFEKALTAITDDNLPMEHPLAPVRMAAKEQRKGLSFAEAWRKVAAQYEQAHRERDAFNKKNFTILADFRQGNWPGWQMDGLGLRGQPSLNGEFIVETANARAIAAILPAGAYTHTISDKLNGVLRSPILSSKHKYISFQVLGDRAAAVRLVSNNCQLNYRNFKYLTKNELHWITLPIPEDAENLRVYAEIMTKLDNPKFPDQLGSLGAGKDYRMPWEKAIADPRSHFGVTQVVLHDQPNPPKSLLMHLHSLFVPAPADLPALAKHVAAKTRAAALAWENANANEGEAMWLNVMVQGGLLSNHTQATPKLSNLIAEYRKLEADLSLPRVVPGLADFGPGFDQPIFTRGDCMKPGEKAPRGYVNVLLPSPLRGRGDGGKGAAPTGSGRLELANLIASPDNPLTARVMVNRVWHHLFGAGLVRTVDDFGHVGELPSHPELLDYLAHQFSRSLGMSAANPGDPALGWSIKQLIRRIVLTRAFRQSHTANAKDIEIDPENRLLSRYPARRMEAEAIRDAILFTSGRLDRTLYGMSISAYRDKEYPDRRLFKGPLDGNGRRSIYIRVTLMEPPKFLEIFNFPGGKVCQGRRDVTDTPAQALALLNDPFVHQQAEVWAKALVARKNDTLASRLEAMFATALGRPPRSEERERFERYAQRVAEAHGVPREGVLGSAAVWRDVGHALFNVREFITIP